MAHPQKTILVDWNSIPIWCCGEFFTGREISNHTEEVHSNKGKVDIHEIKEAQIDINFNESSPQSDNDNFNESLKLQSDNDNKQSPQSDNDNKKSLQSDNNNKRYIHEGPIQHSCNLCDYKSPSKNHLKRHKECRHQGIRYSCEVCEKTFSRKYVLDNHIKNKHIGMNSHKDTAQEKSNFTEDISKHAEENNNQNSRHSENINYIISDNKPFKFSCDLCVKVFKYGSSLRKHKRYIHEGIVHSCDLCDFNSPRKYNLKLHKECRHQGIRYSCQICEGTFSEKRRLKVHMENQHQGIHRFKDTVREKSKQTGEEHNHKEMAGEIKKYAEEIKIQKEVNIYRSPSNKTNEGQMEINLNKKWTHKSHVHEGPIYYSCDLCDYKSPRKHHLKRHKECRHQGIRYSCQICEGTFSEKDRLKVHIENKHLGIRHECEVCHFQATTKKCLTRHKKRHLKPQNHNDSGLDKPSLQNEMAQPLSKKKRKLFSSSLEEVLICEPEENEYFSPKHKKKHRTIDIEESMSGTPQNHDANAEIEVHHDVLLSSPTPKKKHGNIDIKESFTETPQNDAADTEFEDHINRVALIGSKDSFDEPNVEVHEKYGNVDFNDKESLAASPATTQNNKVLDCVQVPSWRMLPQFSIPPDSQREDIEDIEKVALEEEANILKLHAKLEKEEKQRKKWDVQWLKRQEDIHKLKTYNDRNEPASVNLEEEEVDSLGPNIEDIQTIVVREMEDEPVIVFGFVLPHMPKASFSLPWLKESQYDS